MSALVFWGLCGIALMPEVNAGRMTAQRLADICLEWNISKSRLSVIATPEIPDVDQWFIDNNVSPWWFG